MCLENICIPWGVCNGSMGTVYDVILNEDEELEYILVRFDDLVEAEMNNYNRLIEGEEKIIPIAKDVRKFTVKKGEFSGETFWKCQFGLTLGYSFCVEKIQGANID